MRFDIKLGVFVRGGHLNGGYMLSAECPRAILVDSLDLAKEFVQRWVGRNRQHNAKLLLHLHYKIEIFSGGASVWVHDENTDGPIPEIGGIDPRCCGGACCDDAPLRA